MKKKFWDEIFLWVSIMLLTLSGITKSTRINELIERVEKLEQVQLEHADEKRSTN